MIIKKRSGYALLLVTGFCAVIFLGLIAISKLISTDSLLVVKNRGRKATQRVLCSTTNRQFVEFVREEGEECRRDVSTVEDFARTVLKEHATLSREAELFRDDFSSGTSKWDVDGVLVSVAAVDHWVLSVPTLLEPGAALAGTPFARNYSLTASTTVTSGSGVRLLARATREPKLTAYVSGFNLLENPLRGGSFFIEKWEQGKPTRLATKSLSLTGLVGFTLNLRHQYTLLVNQEQIRLSVDGKEVLSAVDESPLTRGRFGIMPALGSNLLIDEVSAETVDEIRSRWWKI